MQKEYFYVNIPSGQFIQKGENMFSLKKKETSATPTTVSPAISPVSAPRPVPAMPTPHPAAQVPPYSATQVPPHPAARPIPSPRLNIPADSTETPPMPTAATMIPSDVSQTEQQSTENRFARPVQTVFSETDNSQYAPPPEHRKEKEEAAAQAKVEKLNNEEPHVEIKADGKRVFVAKSIADVKFADCWYTPEGINYIRDKSTKFALIPFEAEDQEEFLRALEQGYTGSSSYALRYAGENYRVERIVTVTGIQYNCRKMPTETPNLYKLGIPDPITKYLATLAPESGLILFGGPTGMGKTTTASALMKEFLEQHGGFLYTIEDPPEMPLDGLYHARNGALGLCKQCPVENEHWEDGIKSALRSKPRYILVGEIRSPEVASQVLRAATSGHLVLSTIHATSVEDALNSIIKYAMGAGLDQQLVADLLARGILAVVHQKLEGTTVLHPIISTVFANPNPLAPDQLRNAIREGRISLGTLMEAQSTRMFKGLSMFKEM